MSYDSFKINICNLGALIFGEGVLNDALSIVLFKSLLLYMTPSWSGYPIKTPTETTLQIIFKLTITVLIQLIASCVIGLTCGLLNARFFLTL